jgi:hypothetical protein
MSHYGTVILEAEGTNMHHHNNDLWMIDNDIRQQRAHIDLWGILTVANQWGTNRRLDENNEALAENNRLLEKIRRQLLTPAERAAEDKARAVAKAAAEARRKRENKMILISGLGVLVFICILSYAHPGTQTPITPEPAPVQVEQPTQRIESASPQPDPPLERHLEIQAQQAGQSDYLPEAPVRRAQLVRTHHRHR